ncbi:MAG: hypothetical protein GWM92_18855 [Gemmatimonadetes bacterium]|nr:aminomethyl transferase family protein [Gemmatimonadota bacterium]NIR80862.1 aminomethyl transferase family protein [Gemmatimonadota bacterium]NIT89681.1 aminomethyl transferase family protein [Gemmatimonadota bacterium]NIU33461.1 aminomethyl transferase family protein [Gemmatimonadota bacterium]NIU37747.1 hypothetical protein [Gemmatimonadota bacterium]
MSAPARTQELRGVRVARHFGDPAAEYEAAREGAGIVDRSHRRRWKVRGRAPGRMLDGILTCAIPEGLGSDGSGTLRGAGAYGAVLTPKGKMVTDLRILPWSPEADEQVFLLDVPAVGAPGLDGHFGKYLPPRFAAVEDVSEETGMMTVVGPGAASLVSREALGLQVEIPVLEGMNEASLVVLGGSPGEGVAAIRCGDVDAPAYDLVADRDTLGALVERLEECGDARRVGHAAWETLRVEAGRPAFGDDMDEDTIPVEAGIHRRAIDYAKGCYTGQEVIVRIRDRGRVNWHLRGLLMGDVPTPSQGTELYEAGGENAVGRVTSSIQSPRFDGAAGLGYVRREVEPPAEIRLGGPGGSPVGVRALDDGGWVLVEGDPGGR